MVLPER